ncbi:MAG: DUF751 family protein [Cyanobacteria bacterium P01_H01_bin.15]
MQEFFENASRYPRFLLTIIFGIFFSLFGYLRPLFKNPASIAALIGILISFLVFIGFTLRAMLGVA